MQLDMFDSMAVQNLREEVAKLAKSNIAVRRGLFARNTQLEKYMSELQTQVEQLEREVYQLRQKLANQEPECQIHELEKVM